MADKKTKVKIASTTIWDDSDSNAPKLLYSWEYEELQARGLSQISIQVFKSLIGTIDIAINDTIEIWEGFTTSTDKKVFSGYISEYKANGALIEITGKDKLWDLVRKNVNHIYTSDDTQAGVMSAIAEDLIETYGGLTAQVVNTGTESGYVISKFKCLNTDIYERLMALADAARYQVWYDANNDVVHFEPEGYNSTSTSLTVGTEIIGLPIWTMDTSQMVNDLTINGAVAETQTRFPFPTGSGQINVTTDFDTDGITLPNKPQVVELLLDASDPPTTIKLGGGEDSSTTNFYYVDKINNIIKPAEGTTFTANFYAIVNYSWLAPAPVRIVDDDSILSYGLFQKKIELSDTLTIADAEVRATEFVDRLKEPFHNGEILIKDISTISLNVGDTVRVIDSISAPTVNSDFTITRKISSYPSPTVKLIVGDEKLRLDDWQDTIENRVRRLEEKDTNDDDLIREIRSWTNIASQVVPRYLKILTRAYNLAAGISIWGYGSGDGFFDWGSGKWGLDADAFDAEETAIVMQYQDLYEEDFLDTDFIK